MNFADIRRDYVGEPLSETDRTRIRLSSSRAGSRAPGRAKWIRPRWRWRRLRRDGRPSVRTVLLKGVEGGGFVFYTNYDSRKARDLAATGHAALLFYWASLDRQVRVSGRAEKVSERRVRRLFQPAAHREPLGRLRVRPEPSDSEPRGARVALRDCAPGVRRSGPATGMVGRLPGRAGRVRVLAGSAQPVARSLALSPRQRRLDPRTPGALARSALISVTKDHHDPTAS